MRRRNTSSSRRGAAITTKRKVAQGGIAEIADSMGFAGATPRRLKKANKDGMPEDLQKEYEQLVQKETDSFSKKIDELVSGKEKEIMTV